jgi:hypothetical protein
MTFENSLGIFSGQHQNKYTQSETNQFTVEFGEITKGFAEAMSEGLNPADDKVQELVRKHYEFVSKFWAPTKETYKSLAMSYILPSPYKDSYDAVAPGLGKYHYDAIQIWAEQNL